MGVFDNFPYTNIHELNLDWLISTVKQIKEEWENFGYSVTAQALKGSPTSVVVTGDLETGLNFRFTIEPGEQGDQGPQGVGIEDAEITPQGRLIFTLSDGSYLPVSGATVIGPQGEGLNILGKYVDLTALNYAHPTGNAGDMYLVGNSDPYELYLWDVDTNDWVTGGTISSPSRASTNPLMDGSVNKGSSVEYARADHVHPSDTNKQNKLVSGTNIKTINSQSILGSGDLQTLSLEDVYPVGSIYMNASVSTNPNLIFGFGTWVALEDMFLLGASATYPLNTEGGETEHKLDVSEIPSHQHGASQHVQWVTSGGNIQSASNSYWKSNDSGQTGLTGGGMPHNNMPPYLAVHIWKRTA